MSKIFQDPRLPIPSFDIGYLQRLNAALYERLRDLAITVNSTFDGWDDLRFPAQGINPAGSAAPPTLSNVTGMLEFAGNADNVITGVAQLPHAWKKGSIIRPHIHLRFPTSNAGKNTRWKFEYDVASVNADFANAYGTLTTLSTITVANPANAKKHAIASFGDMATTGLKESACIMWKISRLAATDVADDDTSVCVLLEFDIHFQIEKTGTPLELPI